MQYLFADITIIPYSETASDVLSAMLGEIGYDTFEQTDNGVKAYIRQDDFNEESLTEVLCNFFIPDTQFEYSIQELENKDWNEEWEKNAFDPVLEREFGIKLNPRMAFGSGSHETTHQIVEQLFEMSFNDQRVLDMGTGTGVLGIAMGKKGAKEIVAIDIDEFSIENAKENFSLNNINNVEVLLGDASAIDGSFDTIVANIHKNILKSDIPTYIKHLSNNGTLIISGFYSDDVEEMEKCAEDNNLHVSQVFERNNWVVMKLTYNA